jgi:hypothetical protein
MLRGRFERLVWTKKIVPRAARYNGNMDKDKPCRWRRLWGYFNPYQMGSSSVIRPVQKNFTMILCCSVKSDVTMSVKQDKPCGAHHFKYAAVEMSIEPPLQIRGGGHANRGGRGRYINHFQYKQLPLIMWRDPRSCEKTKKLLKKRHSKCYAKS